MQLPAGAGCDRSPTVIPPQQRRAQLKMAVMDNLYTQAMAGNAGAQIRFLAATLRLG